MKAVFGVVLILSMFCSYASTPLIIRRFILKMR
jgi:hypothetical protein